MVGYDTGGFGADDGVTPAAACTVVLRYMDLPDIQWDYNTACQTALDQGLTTAEAVAKTEITRGDLAIMLYRALGNTDLKVVPLRKNRREQSAGTQMAPSICQQTALNMCLRKAM